MHIDVLTEEQYTAYDAFLLEHHNTLLFQSSRYMSLIQDLLGCRQATLIAVQEDGTLCGALPLMEADGSYGTVVNSLPFYGGNGGLIGNDPSVCNLLADAYNAKVAIPGVAAATVVENPLSANSVISLRHELTDERIGQFTSIGHLVNHEAVLMDSFHYKTRNMIRKADKLGATMAVENDAMDFIVQVHEENMREIGGQAKPRRFFELIPVHFRAGLDYNIYVTRLGGEPVAAVLLFYFNRTVEYFSPVVRKEFRDSQGLSASIYRAMCDASKAGFHWWNWGGTWLSQDGVYRFKSRWNTQDLLYRYFTTVKNPAVLQARRSELLSDYPFFYVVPFTSLHELTLA
jgi:hypothetical protein